jgi:hypothetical protein
MSGGVLPGMNPRDRDAGMLRIIGMSSPAFAGNVPFVRTGVGVRRRNNGMIENGDGV